MIREMYHKGHEANTKRMQGHLRDRHGHLYADDNGSCCERLSGLFSAHAVAEDFLKTPSDDLPAQTREGIEAMQECVKAFNARALQMYSTSSRRTNEDLENFLKMASGLKFLVSDTSFTSSFSAEPLSAFWRGLTTNHSGILDFVVRLREVERMVLFGILIRLQRWTAEGDPAKHAIHDLIADEDRSSVLYYLLAATEKEFTLSVGFLHGLVQTVTTHDQTPQDRIFLLPSSVHRRPGAPESRRRQSLSERLSVAMNAKMNQDINIDDQKLVRKFKQAENKACKDALEFCAAAGMRDGLDEKKILDEEEARTKSAFEFTMSSRTVGEHKEVGVFLGSHGPGQSSESLRDLGQGLDDDEDDDGLGGGQALEVVAVDEGDAPSMRQPASQALLDAADAQQALIDGEDDDDDRRDGDDDASAAAAGGGLCSDMCASPDNDAQAHRPRKPRFGPGKPKKSTKAKPRSRSRSRGARKGGR